ncbi:MAG: hypothetical protein ABIH39_04885 [Candidatus Margulisiibacteriota bacterium]
MGKRTIGILFFIVLVGGVFFTYKYPDYFKKFLFPKQPSQVREFVFQGAKVIEVKDDSIIVQGTVKSSDLATKDGTFEFTFTPDAVLKNVKMTVTAEQAMSKKSFSPKTETMLWRVSDIVSGTQVTRVKTNKDLFKATKAEISEIDFFTYDLPVL